MPLTPGQGYAHQHPCHGPTAYAYTHSVPGILLGTSKAPTPPHPLLFCERRGTVAQVYPRPQDSGPQGMAPTGCHYGTPAPIATQPVSTLRFPSTRPSHKKPRSKDLCYHGKSSWKAFLHKFMRLARSEQWTEVEQHEQFCFALERMASEYYTLLLETDPGVRLGAILKKFEKRFGSSAPDLTHQMNFQSAVQGIGNLSPSASDPTGYSPWLPGPSLSSQTCMPRPFPDCVTGPRTRMRECVPLMVSLRRWRRRWTRCSFFQYSRQGRPPKPKRDVRAVTPKEEPQGTGMVALPGKFRISRAPQGLGESPCNRCSLTRL